MHSLRLHCLEGPAAAWRFAKAGGGALALGALWMFAGSCLANETPRLSPHCGTIASSVHEVAAAGFDGNHCLDIVIVEPHGRGPQGFRYRIVLNSSTLLAESSLDLTADQGGLLVTARDVDGIGNDLDLIIKTARSFTPVGVWIDNHHGGFTKADASVYAPSIWVDGPFMLSVNSPGTFQGAILLWHQSYIHPSTRRCPGERWMRQGFVDRVDLHVPSRLRGDPQHARGPPRLPL